MGKTEEKSMFKSPNVPTERKTPILQLATDEASRGDDFSTSSIGKDDINPVVTLRDNLFYKNQYELQFF